MVEQQDYFEEIYNDALYDYQRIISRVAHFAFEENRRGYYTDEGRAKLGRIATKLNDEEYAASNLVPRDFSSEGEENTTLQGGEVIQKSEYFTVRIPRLDELQVPQVPAKKLNEAAEISLRGKITDACKLLSRMGIDLQAEAIIFPTLPDVISGKTMPLKETKRELVALGYASRKEIQTNEMDIYALVTMLLLRGNAANLINGTNGGRSILRTEEASRKAIIEEVNNWLVENWYLDE